MGDGVGPAGKSAGTSLRGRGFLSGNQLARRQVHMNASRQYRCHVSVSRGSATDPECSHELVKRRPLKEPQLRFVAMHPTYPRHDHQTEGIDISRSSRGDLLEEETGCAHLLRRLEPHG